MFKDGLFFIEDKVGIAEVLLVRRIANVLLKLFVWSLQSAIKVCDDKAFDTTLSGAMLAITGAAARSDIAYSILVEADNTDSIACAVSGAAATGAEADVMLTMLEVVAGAVIMG